ncbi:hypothetical protein BCR35DRAFT_355269 [Leucosporidium creatinivorum]|uniref:Uncharacterized protein n=1 Tax=Leucosporidium creatinivorum TaxID=106004 RepID=A0A1Y2DL76_9BASI|nr:hypothetical protein BCR35DRAFT_355269 [Leucosporidium creatinivorum]
MGLEGPSLLYALPPELLTKIATLTSPSFASPTHGDKRPLARLRLTSRLLYEIASPLFWHTVRIPGNASRGSLGHNEAFARLFKMRERGEVPRPRTLIKEMLFVVPDGTYQLSASLLGSFTALRTLHLEVTRPDRHSIAFDSSLAEGLLDLPQLEELRLIGFTSRSDSSFTIYDMPNLHTLALENCESLNRLLGLEKMVPHLKLAADAADRPIDNWLTDRQWDQVEMLELGGATFADILSEPGALPRDLVDSLMALGHPPTHLQHLHLDSFVLVDSSRAEELFAALKRGPLTSLRFASLRSSSALKELSAVSALFPQLETLQIDDFEWNAETASFTPLTPLLDNFTVLRTLRVASRPSSSPFPLSAELIAAAADSTAMLRVDILDAREATLFNLVRASCEEKFVVYE